MIIKHEVDVDVKCPYCDVIQGQIVKQGFNTLLCYVEESGGCGRYFIVDIWFVVKTTVFEMVEHKEVK